jgi:hypothetical protein
MTGDATQTNSATNVYLLRHLGAFTASDPKDCPLAAGMTIAEKGLGLKTWRILLKDSAVPQGLRMLFCFNRPASEQQTHQVAEAVVRLAELFSGGPLIERGQETELIIPVLPPVGDDPPLQYERIDPELLVSWSWVLTGQKRNPKTIKREILDCHYFSPYTLAAAWAFTHTALQNPSINQALAFHSSSIRGFYVYPGEIQEAIAETIHPSILPEAETAFQNAYKAIEALVGDPPKDDRKLTDKLKRLGINPQEEVGLRQKKTLQEHVRQLNLIRDKRVAHGKTRSSQLQILEVIESQQAAGFIIEQALEALGGPLDRWAPKNSVTRYSVSST